MKTHAALISTFMSTVSVIYTFVIHACIIQPYKIAPWSSMWLLFAIPAFMLVIYAIGLVLYAVTPKLYVDDADRRAEIQ